MSRLCLLLILSVAVVGCGSSDTTDAVPASASSAAPVKSEFWSWFDKSKDSIAESMKSGDNDIIQKTLGDVNGRMQKVSPGISFLFGDLQTEYEFVVTAGGDQKYFANVQSFVDAAPTIEGWKITAFRPPSDSSDFKLQMGGIEIGAADIQFQAFEVVDGIGITLYPTDMTEDKRDLYANAAVVILDHLVGEYEAVTKIQSLMLEPPSKAEEGVPMRPMTELREFLKQR